MTIGEGEGRQSAESHERELAQGELPRPPGEDGERERDHREQQDVGPHEDAGRGRHEHRDDGEEAEQQREADGVEMADPPDPAEVLGDRSDRGRKRPPVLTAASDEPQHDHEHRDEEPDVDDRLVGRLDVGPDDPLDHTHTEAGPDDPGERAHAGQQGDDQHLQEELLDQQVAGVVDRRRLNPLERRGQDRRCRGERACDGPDDGGHPPGRGAVDACRVGVVGRRPHGQAETGPGHEQAEKGDQRRHDEDHRQLPRLEPQVVGRGPRQLEGGGDVPSGVDVGDPRHPRQGEDLTHADGGDQQHQAR